MPFWRGATVTLGRRFGGLVGSYARRRVDKQGSAHRTTPDNGVIYKSGYFTVTAQNFKSLFPNFTDPLTSRSPNSSDKSVGCRLHCSRDEGSMVHHMVAWASQFGRTTAADGCNDSRGVSDNTVQSTCMHILGRGKAQTHRVGSTTQRVGNLV